MTDPVELLRQQAQDLVPQLDATLRSTAEAAALAELRIAGVSERRIRALYPLAFDAYSRQVQDLLNRPASWLSMMLWQLFPAARVYDLPTDLIEWIEARVSKSLRLGSQFSSLRLAGDSKDQLEYLILLVRAIAEADLTRLGLLSTAMLIGEPSWEWGRAQKALVDFEQGLAAIRLMLNPAALVESEREPSYLYDPKSRLGHPPFLPTRHRNAFGKSKS